MKAEATHTVCSGCSERIAPSEPDILLADLLRGEERMTTNTKDLEREYQERKVQIRADSSLSWEKQEKAIKALGDEFDARRRELEEEAA